MHQEGRRKRKAQKKSTHHLVDYRCAGVVYGVVCTWRTRAHEAWGAGGKALDPRPGDVLAVSVI